MQKHRDYQHIFGEDSVSIFAKENNTPVPKMKILETDLTLEEGSKKEGIWIELYKKDGWNILNKAKAGSIGRLGKGKSKYTDEFCSNLSKECSDRSEFKEKYPQAYKTSLKMGWIDNYTWLRNTNSATINNGRKRKYSYQFCYEEAKKYNTITDFERGNKGACRAARANGWIKDYTWFTLLKHEKWNKETCYEEAKKYKTLDDFRLTSCYAVACKNKWIDDYVWLKRKHTRRGFWQDYNNCKEEAKKYKTRNEFARKSSAAYNFSCKNGWLDEFFPKNK